jgi:hypothetical protein
MLAIIKDGKVIATHSDDQDLTIHLAAGGAYEGATLVGLVDGSAIQPGDDDPRSAMADDVAISGIRLVRDHRLELSDWTQISDSPLGSGLQADWGTYRQELRDFPATVSNPQNPTWPTEP